MGSAHADRSGFHGPWTNDYLNFDNSYFKDLLKKEWNPSAAIERQFEVVPSGKEGSPKNVPARQQKPMMMMSDIALVIDPVFRDYVKEFANDQAAFFTAFSAAFEKLQEKGVDF